MKIEAIKKIVTIMLCIAALFLVGVNSIYATENCWYIKRNGNLQPKMEKEASILQKYNAFYIDERHGDDSNEKVIYLTFDTGYENGNVEKILDILKEESVPAAFFLLDNIIIKNTDLVKRMAREGHLVCNHTKNHKDLTSSTKEEIRDNIIALEEVYKAKTGLDMTKYFRFPEGKYSEGALKSVCELGYTTVFWSFAYADWDNKCQPKEDLAIKKILDNTHNGAIILLHPTSSTNAKILRTVIKKWREMGYRFGTLDELTK